MSPQFGPAELRRGLAVALGSLRAHRDVIDAANVFPVPDGDTGTNMTLTVASATEASSADDESLADEDVRGALTGARGNSGVVLAQILRGFLSCGLPAGPSEVRKGLSAAADLAYEAVLHPVEGTILTVARAAADGAGGDTVTEVMETAAESARDAVERTPDQLRILKESGVVDAGGLGLWVFYDAVAASLSGRDPRKPPASGVRPRRATLRESGSTAFAHEVQYVLEADDDRIPALRSALGRIGDSVVVSGGAGFWSVHVHTNDTAAAERAGAEAGLVRNVVVGSFSDSPAAGVPVHQIPVKRSDSPVTIVAVVSGAGLAGVFGELGAGVLVDGGATMNPSVGELRDAIEAAPTGDVLVLPNNANGISAAREACALAAGKRAAVIETFDQAHGFTSMLAYGDTRDFETNRTQMARAASVATSAKVVLASRDSAAAAGPIRQGQALGFSDNEIIVVEDDPRRAVEAVAAWLDEREGIEALTLFWGAPVPPDEAASVLSSLREAMPGVEIDGRPGGQPIERYLIAVE